jgi:hypothetical protein
LEGSVQRSRRVVLGIITLSEELRIMEVPYHTRKNKSGREVVACRIFNMGNT